MEFGYLLDPVSHLTRQALDLYDASFPYSERRPHQEIVREFCRVGLPASGEYAHFLAVVENDRVHALALINYFPSFRLGFLAYMAVNPDRRSKGLGTQMYAHLVKQVQNDTAASGTPPLALCFEVENPWHDSCDFEQQERLRRISFYQRNGAGVFENYEFLAPPREDGLDVKHFMLMLHPISNRDCNAPDLLKAVVEMLMVRIYQLMPAADLYQDNLRRANAWTGKLSD